MLEFDQGKRTLRVIADGETVLFHSAPSPFITADSVPLTQVRLDESAGTVQFYAGRRSVTFAAGERNGALALTLKTSSHTFARVTLRFPAAPDAGAYGGGAHEQPNLRGRRISLWAGDGGGYGSYNDEEVVGSAFLHGVSRCVMPILFFHDGEHRWYSVDFGGRAAASFTSRAHHELTLHGLPSEIRTGYEHGGLAGILLRAPRPRERIPDWCYEGIQMGASGGVADVLRRLDRFVASGTLVGSVYIRDIAGVRGGAPFNDFGWSEELYPRLPDLAEKLKTRRIRLIARATPLADPDGLLYADMARGGMLARDDAGRVLLTEVDGVVAAHIDLSNPLARELCVKLMRERLVNIGITALQPEKTGVLPKNAVLTRGSGTMWRNRWAALWSDICRRALEGIDGAFVFDAPADGTGSAFAAGGSGLKTALGEALSLSLSGIAHAHIDLGAHFDAIAPRTRMETSARFFEMAAFMPFFRVPAQSGRIFDEDTFTYVVRCAGVHAALGKYFDYLLDEYRHGGLPPVKYVATRRRFMLGEDILAAPVLKAGQTDVTVRLTEGAWVRLGGGERYDVPPEGMRLATGAQIGSPAIFFRENSAFSDIFERLTL